MGYSEYWLEDCKELIFTISDMVLHDSTWRRMIKRSQGEIAIVLEEICDILNDGGFKGCRISSIRDEGDYVWIDFENEERSRWGHISCYIENYELSGNFEIHFIANGHRAAIEVYYLDSAWRIYFKRYSNTDFSCDFNRFVYTAGKPDRLDIWIPKLSYEEERRIRYEG